MYRKRPFTDLQWHLTPEPVRHYILYLEQALADMAKRVSELENHIQANEKRLEKLEVQAKKNSQNSSKPPSSDPPFDRAKRKKKSKKNAATHKTTTLEAIHKRIGRFARRSA